MAWGAIKLAKKGLEWQNRSESITITAVKTGSGIRTEPVEEMEDLVQVRQATEITDMKITESLKQIHAKFTGRNIPESYAFRELGVYGKVTGTEDVFLYAACFFEEGEPALVSAENPAEFYSILTMRIGNAAEMTIEISEPDYFTRNEAQFMYQELFEKTDAHALFPGRHLFVQTNESSSAMESLQGNESISFSDGDLAVFVPSEACFPGATLDLGGGPLPLWNLAAGRAMASNEMAPKVPYVLEYGVSRWNVRLPYLERYTTSGTRTWTAPYTGLYEVIVTGGGGGGGSARANSTAASYQTASAGGGGGGTAIARIWLTKDSSVSVTVGAGGSAGNSGNAGGSGGVSSFGSYCSAAAGSGGEGLYNTVAANGFRPGGVGGIGMGGDLNLRGGDGQSALNGISLGGNWTIGGAGGDSFWSSGPSGRATNANNSTPGVYGAGGGGVVLAGSATYYRGSAGGAGVVQIRFLGDGL